MAALFGNSSDGRSEPRSLVEFRAGKMKLAGSTVTADTRKGLVYMKQDDRLMHFYWKDRKSGEVVDDLILFPGEVEFKRVAQCTTGRVYLLKFRDRPDRKYFYWMQEPKDSRDEELQTKVNDLINNPPDPSQAMEGLGGGLQSLLGGHGSLQSLLAGAHSNPQILEQLLSSGALSPLPPGMFDGISQSSSGGSGRASASTSSVGGETARQSRQRSATSQATPSRSQQQQQQQQPRTHQLQLNDLQNILSSMNIPPAASQEPSEPPGHEEAVSLTDVVTPDILRPLSMDPSVQEQVQPHLPPTSERLDSVLTSPQFQQALGTFSGALQSGQLGALMGQFGLGGVVVNAANAGSVNIFAEALQGELGEQGSSAATAEGGGEPAGSDPGGPGTGNGQPGADKKEEEEEEGEEGDKKTPPPSGETADKQ